MPRFAFRPGQATHTATIKGPPSGESSAYDGRGQPTDADVTVLADVPCSVVELAGRELEVARKVFASATYRVMMWGEPGTVINTQHYLTLDSSEVLYIGHAVDSDLMGYEYVLLCSREKP